MLRENRGAWAVCLLLCAGMAQLWATRVIPMNLVDLVQRSARVFEGRCIAVEDKVLKNRNGDDVPAVSYTFEILDDLKGAGAKTIVISHLGRFRDGRSFLIDPDHLGIPRYRVDRRYLLFMGVNTHSGMCIPIGLSQGVFDIHQQKALNRVGDDFIMAGMASSLKGTRYERILVKPVAAKTTLQGLPLAMLKDLVRELMTGNIEAPTRKEAGK